MTAVSDVFISAIAPLHDDADILKAFVSDTLGVLRSHYSNYELVLIDDGSTDDTLSCVSELLGKHECIRYIRLSRDFGIEVAITAGLDTVIGDYVVVLHPDMDPPALIPDMVARCRRCGGVVFGVPKDRPGEPLWSRVGRRVFHWVASGLLGFKMPKSASQFQALSRNAINAVTRMRDKNRHLRLLSLNVGYATEVYAYELIQRRGERRTRGFIDSLSLAARLAVSNSLQPLRILTVLAVVVSAMNLGYCVYQIALLPSDSGEARAWMILSLQSGLMFFLLFLILAALSEYVGRVLDESRDRPLYHVIDERNSNVLIVDVERRNVVADSTLK